MKAIFDEWDIAKTESILKDRELDDNLRAAKTQKRRDAEKKGKHQGKNAPGFKRPRPPCVVKLCKTQTSHRLQCGRQIDI